MNEFSPDSRAMQLLGVGTWDVFTPQEQLKYLKSPQRIKTYSKISTNTLPQQPMVDKKKGIVTRILKEQLVSEDVLKQYPSLYIGSNNDIEYPLALGCRQIVLIDPVLRDASVIMSIQEKLGLLTGKDVIQDENGTYSFMFDFGNGEESVSITVRPEYYHPPEQLIGESAEYHQIPDQIGMVLLFASQSPFGRVLPHDDITSRLVPGGVVLKDRMLDIDNGRQVIDLGQH